jgi:hypothetical protein
MTSNPRWPDFFLVGAPKAGTTSLARYLGQHPGVYLPAVKETHFFAPRFDPDPLASSRAVRDRAEYLALFAAARPDQKAGDCSPYQLWDEDSPRLIREAVPDARILMVLRNPIERAYSHFLMVARESRVRGTFLQELRADREKRGTRWSESNLYVELGLYPEQIRRYQACFPPERIRICLYDDLVRDPEALVRELWTFLDLPETTTPLDTSRRHNPASVPRGPVARLLLESRRVLHRLRVHRLLPLGLRTRFHDRVLLRPEPPPPLPEDARAWLRDTYRDSVAELGDLLGRPLDRWLA